MLYLVDWTGSCKSNYHMNTNTTTPSTQHEPSFTTHTHIIFIKSFIMKQEANKSLDLQNKTPFTNI